MGGLGTEVDRALPIVDLDRFEARRDEIVEAVWEAAIGDGFFQVVNHGLSVAEIDRAFDLAERFFALPMAAKERLPLRPGTNAGWEHRSQVRPSTGTPDEKESYQLTRPRMDGLWPPDDAVPGFRAELLAFEAANHRIAMRLLSCFAIKLGFESDFFTVRHDPTRAEYQSTLRLLHYLPVEPSDDEPRWRAGAHTDFDCLTLLHQREGERGLQLCPGRDLDSGRWTPVEPSAGVITCNIGDMLMRWSDDVLPSTLHRVRVPDGDEARRPRYSIAYFAQADTDAIIEGPERRYPAITADDYLRQRIAANF